MNGPLVGPPRPAETFGQFSVAPSYGLAGYVAVGDGYATALRTLEGIERIVLPGVTIIDLAQVPQSAIVLPPPSRHEGWINIYADGGDIAVHDSREDADREACAEAVPPGRIRIACIRVEYGTGEGLGG